MITKMAFVAQPTTKMDEMKAFYGDALGLDCGHECFAIVLVPPGDLEVAGLARRVVGERLKGVEMLHFLSQACDGVATPAVAIVERVQLRT